MSQTFDPKRVLARFEEWTLLCQPLELWRDGQREHLQELPLQILELLVRRPAELVTREQLKTHLWPTGVVDFDAGLNTAMRKLRVMLHDDADEPKYIETVPRQGYRFVAILRDAEHEPESQPNATVRMTGTGWFIFAAAILASLAAIAWFQSHTQSKPLSYRIAILPFENLSSDTPDSYFADGIHEEILSTLANRAPNLEVISRTTMMLYRGTPRAVAQIAKELRATHVLEGTVRREGEKVRVSLQLIDAYEDRQLWMRSFDRTLTNVMTLQTEVATEVAAALAVRLSPANNRPALSQNPQAYELWMRGTLAWQNVGTGNATLKDILRIEDLYTQAIAQDPTYAAPYADRGRVRIVKFITSLDLTEANLQDARADIAMAEQLAGPTPHVLVRKAILSYLVDGDLSGALALITRAEQAGPLTPDQMMTEANFTAFAGDIDKALSLFARAAQSDPGNGAIFRFWSNALFASHKPAEALAVLQTFEDLVPGRINYGELLFDYTGSTAQWRLNVDRMLPTSDIAARFSSEFDLLRFEKRYTDVKALLAHSSEPDFRQHTIYGSLIGSPRKPLAELRGWERLMAGDPVAAAHEGQLLMNFVSTQTANRWNEWWLCLLQAEASAFKGEMSSAITQARRAIRALPKNPPHAMTVYTRSRAARIIAWAGAQDEAVELLETLTTNIPVVGPAKISRDPLYAIPLQKNARYQQLITKLELEIKENQKLLRRR